MLKIHALLFAADGTPLVNEVVSSYARSVSYSSSRFAAERTIEYHLVQHNDTWFVVSSTGNTVYLYERAVPTPTAGQAHIDAQADTAATELLYLEAA